MHSDVVLVGKAFIGHTSSISAVTKKCQILVQQCRAFYVCKLCTKVYFCAAAAAKIGTVPLPILELLELFLGFLENPLTLFLVLILR